MSEQLLCDNCGQPIRPLTQEEINTSLNVPIDERYKHVIGPNDAYFRCMNQETFAKYTKKEEITYSKWSADLEMCNKCCCLIPLSRLTEHTAWHSYIVQNK